MNIPSLLPCSSPWPSPSRKATVRNEATKAGQSKLPHPLRTSNRQKSAPIIYNRSTAKFPLYHKFPISRRSGCLALQPHDGRLSILFLNFQPPKTIGTDLGHHPSAPNVPHAQALAGGGVAQWIHRIRPAASKIYPYLSTHLATRMLTSYSKYNGMVTKMRVIKSGGVITAATSIMMRNECFRYFDSISEETNPSFVNAKAITGN